MYITQAQIGMLISYKMTVISEHHTGHSFIFIILFLNNNLWRPCNQKVNVSAYNCMKPHVIIMINIPVAFNFSLQMNKLGVISIGIFFFTPEIITEMITSGESRGSSNKKKKHVDQKGAPR